MPPSAARIDGAQFREVNRDCRWIHRPGLGITLLVAFRGWLDSVCIDVNRTWMRSLPEPQTASLEARTVHLGT